MHYIITDIHNDNRRFTELLQKINLTEKDHLYLLGDLFDRCEDHADPVGVYFQMLRLGEQCTVIRGTTITGWPTIFSGTIAGRRKTVHFCSHIRTILFRCFGND